MPYFHTQEERLLARGLYRSELVGSFEDCNTVDCESVSTAGSGETEDVDAHADGDVGVDITQSVWRD